MNVSAVGASTSAWTGIASTSGPMTTEIPPVKPVVEVRRSQSEAPVSGLSFRGDTAAPSQASRPAQAGPYQPGAKLNIVV